MIKFKHILAILFCLFVLLSCDLFQTKSIYSDKTNWLAFPENNKKSIDVFYVYPTVYTMVYDTDPIICSIDNAMMVQGAFIPFSRQATVFDSLANIYAPYYRQADASYTLSLSSSQKDSLIRGIPYSNVKEAFHYYIKNMNRGRPFILAGHSQGSNVLLYLLSDYMKDHPAVYKRMIAAYMIGYSVTPTYLSANPHLKFAENANDFGVIISYNTEAPIIGDPGNPVVCDSAIAINPINWRRDETLASANENLGSILWDSLGTIFQVSHFADAQVDLSRGVVITNTANVDIIAPGSATFGRGVYHKYDYAFYYYNLRKNANDRIEAYFSE